MDKIPKFRHRQKPKPPSIQTSLNRSSTESAASSNGGGGVALVAAAESSPRDARPRTASPASNQPSPVNLKPPRKSAFRSLSRLRQSAKRGRSASPAASAETQTHPARTSGGSAPGSPPRPRAVERVTSGSGPGRIPRMPHFLAQHPHSINQKFTDILWAERLRGSEAQRNLAVEDFKWGVYTELDEALKGMDRYVNIKPWNHNRVKLRVPNDTRDYVNASAIVLQSQADPSLPPLKYIAMQGPTEPSFSYVWRMIAEQIASPAVIVQLTSMVENNHIKCSQYFPYDTENATWQLNETNEWGDGWAAKLTYDSLEELADGAIEKRKLLLHVEGEGEPRIVWHFLYRRWPDFGVPAMEDMNSFFELMKLSREHSNPNNARIIHCSAGVGRTGSFITLEHLIRELEAGALAHYDENGPDLIYDTVESLRQQRRAMVQADVQFRFIYEVVRRLWQDKYDGGRDGEPEAKRLEVEDDTDIEIDSGDGSPGGGVDVLGENEPSTER